MNIKDLSGVARHYKDFGGGMNDVLELLQCYFHHCIRNFESLFFSASCYYRLNTGIHVTDFCHAECSTELMEKYY